MFINMFQHYFTCLFPNGDNWLGLVYSGLIEVGVATCWNPVGDGACTVEASKPDGECCWSNGLEATS